MDVCRQLKSWKTEGYWEKCVGVECGTPALHSKETVVEHNCGDVKSFLWQARLFLETFVFAAVYFWSARFLICQTNGEQMIKRVRLRMIDLRTRTRPFFFSPSFFCLSPIKAFSHKLHFSLAADDKLGARPITGTLSATVTTCSSHVCVWELR